MVKLTDIYNSVSVLLISKYPGYQIHGHEVTEGFYKPSFFIDFLSKSMSIDTRNFKKFTISVKISYFPDVLSEIDHLNKIDEIRELFSSKLKVNDRYLTVLDFSYSFVGDQLNQLQMLIDLEYFEQIERENANATANELIVEREVQ